MGPLSWVILGALIGGLTFCLFKIRAWAQSLAIFKGKRIENSTWNTKGDYKGC